MGICYHYCNVDAFLNIVKHRTLWLSDIRRSNDPREGGYAFDDIYEYLDSVCDYDINNYDKYFRLRDLITEYGCEMRMFNNFNAYAICFSDVGDLLSQWRGYTKDLAGLSIGFDESMLGKWSYSCNNKRIAEFRKVHYGERKENKDIKSIVDTLLKLAESVDFSGEPADVIKLLHPFYKYLEERTIEAFFIKDISFHEEKEKRLLYREYYHSDDAHQLEFWENSSINAVNNSISEFSLSDVKYHCWPSGFKKYYELTFDKVRDEFIREIIIGPKCEVSSSDVEELLIREGYQIVGEKGIHVRRSDIYIR